jgi:hypothetical protein
MVYKKGRKVKSYDKSKNKNDIEDDIVRILNKNGGKIKKLKK